MGLVALLRSRSGRRERRGQRGRRGGGCTYVKAVLQSLNVWGYRGLTPAYPSNPHFSTLNIIWLPLKRNPTIINSGEVQPHSIWGNFVKLVFFFQRLHDSSMRTDPMQRFQWESSQKTCVHEWPTLFLESGEYVWVLIRRDEGSGKWSKPYSIFVTSRIRTRTAGLKIISGDH